MLKNIFISIKTKVAISIAITLIFVGLSIYITTNYYLTKIINKSQYAIYNSKIEDIINSLKIKNRQLEKTERVDSYLESFQKNVINEIRAKYYSSNNLEAYPIIMSFDRSVIMHPKLPWGYDKLKNSDFINMLYNLNEGQANYSYENTKKWIVIKNFDKWKWKIAYTVPLKIKYADLANFRNKFFLIFVIILLLTLFMFILIASKLIKPLKVLTDASEALTEGKKADLNLIITNDEVGILAKRFIKMNESINKQFDVINSQKAKTTQIKNYLSNIVNSMPSILIGIDSNFRITQWNLEAQNKTGFTEEIAIGKNLKDLIPRLFPYFDKIKNAIKNRKPYLANNTLYKNNDKIIYENIGIYPLIANGVQGAVIRIDDITKQYQMEQQLNQSRKMDAIGQLAGGVAHDFNNMLTGISGAAQLLQLPKHNLSSKGLNLVDMILNASQRAAELTAKLLAFGRKEELTFEAIDINEIIDSTIEIFNRTIDKKIKIKVNKSAHNTIIFGNKSALQNALLNLGINASHAMKNGGDLTFNTKNIFLTEKYCSVSPFDIKEGNYLQIEIRDTGCGISQENIKKIFDPFFTTKEEGKGTGLGLSSVYGTVKNHFGAITVYSEVGNGTSFHILIPLSQTEIKIENDNEDTYSGSGTILLVDDEEIIRITSKDMLEEMGFKVILAENGLEAVNIFKDKFSEIDLVIMDMIMPEMKGSEAFFKMKEIDNNCKIIITSGFTKDENIGNLRNNGLAGFIQKPFNIFDLSNSFKKLFN